MTCKNKGFCASNKLLVSRFKERFMSEIGCTIIYESNGEQHLIFSSAMRSHGDSNKEPSDREVFESAINSLGINGTLLFSTDFWSFEFKSINNGFYEISLTTIDQEFWSDHVPSFLYSMGCRNIFGHAQETSCGVEFFVTYKSEQSEFIYISQCDEDFDAFLFDANGEYIGTSCKDLYKKYSEGGFSSFNVNQYLNPQPIDNQKSSPSADTMLMHSLIMQDISQLEDAINEGGSFNACDIFGMTPLEIAIHYDNPKIVSLLLENGALKSDKYKSVDNCWLASRSLGSMMAASEFENHGAKKGLASQVAAIFARAYVVMRRIKPVNIRDRLGYEQ